MNPITRRRKEIVKGILVSGFIGHEASLKDLNRKVKEIVEFIEQEVATSKTGGDDE